MMRNRNVLLCLAIAWLAFDSFPAPAQSFPLATNSVVFNFTTLGLNPSLVNSVTVNSIGAVSTPQGFYMPYWTNFSLAGWPSMTNGSVVCGPLVYGLGVTFQIQISDGYETTTTNFCIPANAGFDVNGRTPANQWVGFGLAPNFSWTSPFVTNISQVINITNNIGGVSNTTTVVSTDGSVNVTPSTNVNNVTYNLSVTQGGTVSNAVYATTAGSASNLIGTLPASQLPAVVVTNTYNLKSFGAYGDAAYSWGAMALSNSTTMTVVGGYFTSADTNKFIDIKGADVNRRDWWTTITAVNSPNNITVASAVPVSYNFALPGGVAAMSSGYPIVYGAHDDSMAIQSWVNQVTNGGGKFYAPPGIYLVLNPPTNVVNSQIMVPISPKVAGNEVTYFEMYGSLGSAPGYASSSPRVDLDPNTTVFVPNIGTSSNPGQWLQGMPSSFISFQTVGSLNPYGVALGKVLLPASGYYITNTLTWPVLHDFIIQSSWDPSAIILNELGAQE